MAFATVRQQLTKHIEDAVQALCADGTLASSGPGVHLVPPKQAEHGDYACTLALALAKPERKNPRQIAELLKEAVGDAGGLVEKVEIAGPGYLNFFVSATAWRRTLAQLLATGEEFVRSDHGAGQKVLLEYVSANPTGPLHIAHGRGAVAGDIIARTMKLAGYDVEREYYINDKGHQTEVLANSVYLRYGELFGRTFEEPEDFYPGEYVSEIAEAIRDEHGDAFLDKPESEWLDLFRDTGVVLMLERIKQDLKDFGIEFDHWTSEREMTERTGLEGIVQRLEDAGHIYEEDGRKWFRTTEFGDDKDRVVVREDGRPTYFASDIAYHDDKMKRGFERLINVFGADHGGYIARVKAGMAGLSHDPEALEVLLVQMVSLSRGGEAVRMGKRLGTAVWLRDVVSEAGRDATRYFFAMRRCDSQMDFDIELATKKSLDNPVYYAQMGHARMCSIERRAVAVGSALPEYEDGALDALALPEELSLIKSMQEAPEVVASAADSREPHQVVNYLQDLIAQFHSYYTKYKGQEKVVSDDVAKTKARLLLVQALKSTLRVLLVEVLGVSAPEEMTPEGEGSARSA